VKEWAETFSRPTVAFKIRWFGGGTMSLVVFFVKNVGAEKIKWRQEVSHWKTTICRSRHCKKEASRIVYLMLVDFIQQQKRRVF